MKEKYTSFTIKQPIKKGIRKNVFACLFSIHNTISLSCHEQVCLYYILLCSKLFFRLCIIKKFENYI